MDYVCMRHERAAVQKCFLSVDDFDFCPINSDVYGSFIVITGNAICIATPFKIQLLPKKKMRLSLDSQRHGEIFEIDSELFIDSCDRKWNEKLRVRGYSASITSNVIQKLVFACFLQSQLEFHLARLARHQLRSEENQSNGEE